MKRFFLNIFLTGFAVFLLSPSLIEARSHKIVLLEEATNVYCRPCGLYNPGLQQMYATHFGGLVSVRYHAWWPGSSDPMYQSNKNDNYKRIVYYNVGDVPTYMIDGVYRGNPYNPAKVESEMYERLAHPSPVRIDIHYMQENDSVKTSVTLHALEALSADSLFLRIAIIERHVVYAFPPGNNEETDFAAVMRKMLPDAKGSFTGHMADGDSLELFFSLPLQMDWNPDDLAVVAWLQDDQTREILQANIDFPTFVLQEKESHMQILPADTLALKEYFIVNDNDLPLRVNIELRDVSKTEGWQLRLVLPESKNLQHEFEIPAGDTLRFYLETQTSERGSASAEIFALNLSDPGFYGDGYGYGFARRFAAVVAENNDVLLVDDDGGMDFQENFEQTLADLDVDFITVAEQELAYFKSQVDLGIYRTLIWNCSTEQPAFAKEQVQLIRKYLDNGGNLLLFGENIGSDIFEENGLSNFDSAKTFYKDYLGAAYLAENPAALSIAGIEGDTISGGISFALDSPYGFGENRPDAMLPDSITSFAVFNYNNDKVAAVRKDNGIYKTICFGFSLEQVKGAGQRKNILRRSLAWAGNVTGVGKRQPIRPQQMALYNNFPNPFGEKGSPGGNPATNIAVYLPRPAQIRVAVYDVMGRLVKEIFAGQRNGGRQTFQWQGKDEQGARVASGLYFYRVQSGGRTLQKKMLFIR